MKTYEIPTNLLLKLNFEENEKPEEDPQARLEQNLSHD
jgi:hypothetical protein